MLSPKPPDSTDKNNNLAEMLLPRLMEEKYANDTSSTRISPDSELGMIATELKHLSLRRQQLLERKNIQCIFQELRNRAEYGQTEEAALSQREIDSIDDKLKQLTERKAKLRERHENLLNGEDKKDSKKEVSITPSQKIVPGVPVRVCDIFHIDPPPNFPAPTVILDVANLPPWPSRTQCPECWQFVMTETHTSVSSVTWLVCFITASLGCVAGCCLIPFCLDKCKTTKHRCPKCRTLIQSIKKL